ncbi:hypothetical protein BMF94_0536 [Rhodotorula taiwanensis]|uniref:Phosphoinositide phospholipase C n=1 Tax=Rhodotorula taiwanensis TaxID=741276 RepID=A0A2S5BHU0_9BASI|nr:hypothetical protein BMF94_0536 [Rhodotorula taiwanensis]
MAAVPVRERAPSTLTMSSVRPPDEGSSAAKDAHEPVREGRQDAAIRTGSSTSNRARLAEPTGGVSPSRSSPRRSISATRDTPPRPTPFRVPTALIKPGIEMLKVSAKSARRVKPRRVWLETRNDREGTSADRGLDEDFGGVSNQEVSLCWEKNGPGLGFGRSANYAAVPLSRIRDMRFGVAGSPYRTSLHLPPSVEPRWVTLIYAVPPPSNFLGTVTGSAAYKLVHFIATSTEEISLLRNTLEGFREGRLARGLSEAGTPSVDACVPPVEEKVVRENETTAHPNDFLDFKAFQAFVKLLKRRTDVEAIFARWLRPDAAGLTFDDWTAFVREDQRESFDDAATLRRRFVKYADPTTDTMTLDGFVSFLLSSDNAAIKDETDQDMHRPLSEYFISSSHNTYLIGSQFQGQSSVEGYIRALQQGCRSVEVDIWDGDNGEPAVTHGHTLTSKIPVRNVLEAIAQYAFLASPYPVILSVEVHCDFEQQERLVRILQETLGNRLVSRRLDEMELDADLDKLPSPAELKGRFLLKAKNKFLSASDGSLPIAVSPSDDSSSEQSSYSSSDGDFKNTRFYRAIRQLRGSDASDRPAIARNSSSRSTVHQQAASSTLNVPTSVFGGQLSASPPLLAASFPSPLATPSASPRPKDLPMSQELAKLLVYTVGVKARGFNKKETYPPTHVVSLSESSLSKLLRDEATRQDFVSHNRTHLVRAYPRGRRLTSSNFVPHHMWAAGIQLVALNWQTFDIGMELNSAMFARADRCGYVLKPEYLRRKGAEKDKVAALRSRAYQLEIEVISAQQLPRPRGSTLDADAVNLDPFVEVSLFVPGESVPQKRRTSVVMGNAFNPTFRSHTSAASPSSSASLFTFRFNSHPSPGMLDLIFLRFEVLNAKGNLKAAAEEGKGDSVGAYTIALGALKSGYRHVPLYDGMGDQNLFSTLFLRSRVTSPESGHS